jgi:hypothetical protein
MHATTMRVASSTRGVVVPGFVDCVIYLVIALATEAASVASITGGIVVPGVAVTKGSIVRAVDERRAWGSH